MPELPHPGEKAVPDEFEHVPKKGRPRMDVQQRRKPKTFYAAPDVLAKMKVLKAMDADMASMSDVVNAAIRFYKDDKPVRLTIEFSARWGERAQRIAEKWGYRTAREWIETSVLESVKEQWAEMVRLGEVRYKVGENPED